MATKPTDLSGIGLGEARNVGGYASVALGAVAVLGISALVTWYVASVTLRLSSDITLEIEGLEGVFGGFLFAIYFEYRKDVTLRALPELSGCRRLPASVLRAYYSNEIHLWESAGARSPPVGTEFDFTSDLPKLGDPDLVNLVTGERAWQRFPKYQLPSELEALSWTVSSTLERRGTVFRRDDQIAIVTGIAKMNSGIEIGVARGRLSDEYTTSQNPEMNYEYATWEKLAVVGPRTVRQFFASGHKGNLPSYLHDPPVAPKPALRLSAHLLLLLPPTRTDQPWEERKFLLQVRGGRVATGSGGLTSSMGSGMDYADAGWFRGCVRRLWNRHGRFTNYVLRELREEVLIQSSELRTLALVAIVRDPERLGQPVAALIGEMKPEVGFRGLVDRWKKQREEWGNPWVRWIRGRFLRALRVGSRTGWEHWEAGNLIHRAVGEIDDLVDDPKLEPGTRACLYYLRKIGEGGVKELPQWRPRKDI